MARRMSDRYWFGNLMTPEIVPERLIWYHPLVPDEFMPPGLRQGRSFVGPALELDGG